MLLDIRNHEPKIYLRCFVRETENGLTQVLPRLLEERKSQAVTLGARHARALSSLKRCTRRERPMWGPEVIPSPSLPKKNASC